MAIFSCEFIRWIWATSRIYKIIKTKNESKGLSKETFVNLMTVQEDELFDFSHIWNNAKMDTKGPLGNLPLFLISSFSLNHFSKWQIFLVNIISFVIIQVFLFKISFLITNKKIVSFLIIAFYGFSQAGINTVVFLRVYGKIDKPRKRNNVFDGQHQDEFSPYAIFDYIEYIAYYAKDYIKDYYNGFLGHYRCAFKKNRCYS